MSSRLQRSRFRNAPIHVGRFLAAWALLALGYVTSTVATIVLLPTTVGEYLVAIVALSAIAAWLPAALATSYLAGRGGEA